eukprot:1102417_1
MRFLTFYKESDLVLIRFELIPTAPSKSISSGLYANQHQVNWNRMKRTRAQCTCCTNNGTKDHNTHYHPSISVRPPSLPPPMQTTAAQSQHIVPRSYAPSRNQCNVSRCGCPSYHPFHSANHNNRYHVRPFQQSNYPSHAYSYRMDGRREQHIQRMRQSSSNVNCVR